MVSTARQIWRDYVTDGIPSSGNNKPSKIEIRSWGTWVESILNAIGVNSGTVYQTRALLFADLSRAANTMAWVTSDPTVAYNGVYQKVGPLGLGSWTRVADLPYSFIVASDGGAGTPNAIQATSPIPVSESALVLLNIFESNTGSPVTVAFNGDAALTIKTNTGNDVAAGGLVAGMRLLGVASGSTFRLVSDQASSAIVAAAEAAAAEAADYAALAFNSKAVRSFVGNGTTVAFDLSIDPGNITNTTVFVTGLYQDKNRYSLSGTVITFSEPPPAPDVPGEPNIEVELGNRIDVGTPADRSVTYARMQAVAASRIMGRLSAGAGDMQELTTEQVRAAIGATRPCFVANKGGTNQTGVVSVTETKVTFGTEVTDVGGYYNTSTSRWTPPAGPVHMTASLFFSGALVSGGSSYAVIYKNGAPFRAGANQNGANAGVSAGFVSIIDVASGTDYYEVFGLTTTSSGTATISGGATASRFEGYSL